MYSRGSQPEVCAPLGVRKGTSWGYMKGFQILGFSVNGKHVCMIINIVSNSYVHAHLEYMQIFRTGYALNTIQLMRKWVHHRTMSGQYTFITLSSFLSRMLIHANTNAEFHSRDC